VEIFSTESFSSFIFLLEKELGVKIEHIVSDMLANLQSFILEKEFALLSKNVASNFEKCKIDPSLN